MEYYTCEYFREHDHIGIPITTSSYCKSLAVPVSNVINQFSLGSKLVGITSDCGTNLERCKAISESNFDNIGVFELGEPMFSL